ncbi:ATP-dependent_RNA helicase [Hexamita inflata]|uniref:ATP-dependent RNA helicase n=1 Tax=Hexamita inflata TaxID=28002 RepID=A0AA86Q8N8_9EUKA|nr:ATP-dependent RNA helicase [Hexamita inflata]
MQQEKTQSEKKTTFTDMHISPRLIKNLAKMNWENPTEVQQTTIPLASAGRDLLVQSVTGSGKTGAFAVPIIDRLILRGKYRCTSVLILSPTRELAQQTAVVIQQMINGMQITCALITGGNNDFHTQAILLQNEPDIVVATPGRFIDHLLNSSTTLERIEVLVLDEADKLLELGFMNEITQIVKQLPSKRQTMLFSATMTQEVDMLVSLSLQKPLKLNVDPPRSVNSNIQQQFVLTDSYKQDDDYILRFALLHHLLTTSLLNQKTIVFCSNKHQVNQISAYLKAADFDCFTKLSSELSQAKRHRALEEFEANPSGILISTDLAARGLDFLVESVVLYNCPTKLDEYVHRVGRTGRYDQQGTSICFGSRSELKELVKELGNGFGLKERVISQSELEISRFNGEEFKAKIKQVKKEEEQENKIELTDIKLQKFDQGVVPEKRSWYLSQQDRKAVKEIVKITEQGDMSRAKAQGLLKKNKQVRQELSKVIKNKLRTGTPVKKSEAHDQIRKLKRQTKMAKQSGEYEGRNMKLDARKK